MQIGVHDQLCQKTSSMGTLENWESEPPQFAAELEALPDGARLKRTDLASNSLPPMRHVISGMVAFLLLVFVTAAASAQELSRRLILKDGSYQLATQWEVKGDRVRYLSAERNEWEELPNSLVDWPATDKFARDRAAGVPDAAALELDREQEAERQAEQARTPQVAPGLLLPEDGSVMLLDTFQNQSQLVEIQQDAGELNRNRTKNVLRAVVIPVATSKQTIELYGEHASVQAHAPLPSIYVNVNPLPESAGQQPEKAQQAQPPEQPWDRFHIVHMQYKNGKRIIGEVKINALGKVSQDQTLVLTTAEKLTGGWVKVTPTAPLEPGEYAVVEMLGKDGINTYVWDFGMHPDAPANASALKPEITPAQPQTDKPQDLKTKRQ